MRPAFVGQPLANAVFIVTVVVWMLIEVRQALHRRADAATADRYSLAVLRACVSVGILLAILALRVPAMALPYSPLMFAVSLALMWFGIGLRWWSFRTLGRYFTFAVMTSADQPVISTGPYRLLRHPSYAGLLLALAGVGVAFGNWLSLVALVVLPTIGFIYRIRVEEAALASTLGARYATYGSTRKRIIPFVW
jgi:protein-S-isoprenylcysteine O-methyltransferase Ste14